MPRDKGEWSSKSYTETAEETRRESGGRSTYKGEQRAKQGKGLDRLVDPKEFNGMRESLNLMIPQDDGTFILSNGVAMPIETDLDTTGSMGDNVDVIFRNLPKAQDLIVNSPHAILRGRYHAQFATGVVQDVHDQFPYQSTQFEPDNEIERQMQLLVPEGDGDDAIEDYQLSVYAAGYRRRLSITRYGLKGYYFIAGDERGREFLDPKDVRRVFGEGQAPQSRINVVDLGKKMLDLWHGFFLQIKSSSATTAYWTKILGRERVVILPHTEFISDVQSVIIGLTEGILDLQSATDFLTDVGKVNKRDAQMIVRSVNHIPLRAQAILPNFGKVPLSGEVFASRDDVWPIVSHTDVAAVPTSEEGGINWKL